MQYTGCSWRGQSIEKGDVNVHTMHDTVQSACGVQATMGMLALVVSLLIKSNMHAQQHFGLAMYRLSGHTFSIRVQCPAVNALRRQYLRRPYLRLLCKDIKLASSAKLLSTGPVRLPMTCPEIVKSDGPMSAGLQGLKSAALSSIRC